MQHSVFGFLHSYVTVATMSRHDGAGTQAVEPTEDEDEIVDAHFHLWDLANPYPWLTRHPPPIRVAGDPAPIATSYLVGDYLAETARQKVTRGVHVDAGWDYSDPVAETAWLQSVADQDGSLGFPHGIVARASLESPAIGAVLDAHQAHANLRGIRQIVNWHPDPDKTYIDIPDLMELAAWRRGFAELGARGLSFDLQCYPGQFDQALRLADAFPETAIILNHAGMPVDRSLDGFAAWRKGLAALAERTNVTVKISGLGMMDWHWTVDSIRPYVLECIACFGSDRAMFASNFPVDRLYSSFDALYGAFREIMAGASTDERSLLFRRTACRVYRLG
jgi:predicted TIM-barrel fold metal-dependent hydrolase